MTHAGVQNPSTMTWDADGYRVSFTSSTGGTTDFVYDITAGIPAVIEETGPVYYVREPNGALIVRLDGQYTNYYHFDALGSTRLLTNSSGAVTDTYTYDAWGGVSDQSGSTAQPYQFVGQLGYYFPVQDENFPLLHLGIRFYDPVETGRFTQRDPLTHEAGTYRYAGLQPTCGVDPSGLAYMRFDGNRVCLYHDNGKVWLCCDATSGTAGKEDPIAEGKYRLDPQDICCVNEGGPLAHPAWKCDKDSWGIWRCHLQPVTIKPGCESSPHEECFLHGGCSERQGTLGCIRIPDRGKKKSDCLDRLMRILRGIGTPVGLEVCY